ncbi:REST corepressor 3 [Trichonephila inaurata madagascariensis]|uniref:REST corepressor 3 n=1 Tax=Trichonephila inaurata madagascariensis TaxID=2747483 RepID=A0A8X6YXF8_9ARAC|nr:REST corepressor 3 [Trichonephila inaurata madagascariensis]
MLDIRSGLRSRTSSPYGPYSDESGTTEESEYSVKIGPEYQAVIPDLISEAPCSSNVQEKALLMWAPNPAIDDEIMDKYITEAKDKFGYNVEQSLGMLLWHEYDLKKAKADIHNYAPVPSEWSNEDKILFEQGFQFYGKNFNRIRRLLPDKPLSSVIKYYYLWKKAKPHTSVMDERVFKLSAQKNDRSGSEALSGNESDVDSDKDEKKQKGNCSACNVSAQLYSTARGSLCSACTLSSNTNKESNAILQNLDDEIISLKRQVQNNKQILSQLKLKTSEGIDEYRPPESENRINNRWTNDEYLLAVQGIRRYGKDFKAIAEVIKTKNAGHVKNFFMNFRRRFNLDNLLKEHNAEYGSADEITAEKMEKESKPSVKSDNHPNSPGAPSASSLFYIFPSISSNRSIPVVQKFDPPSRPVLLGKL